MIKFTSSVLSIMSLTTMCMGSDYPIYNHEYTLKTKEIMMLSQLYPEGKNIFNIVTGYKSWERGFFDSFSENKDVNWRGSIRLTSVLESCYSQKNVDNLEKAGFTLKSYNAETTVVAYREAVRLLKESGAKYIYVETGRTIRDPYGHELHDWRGMYVDSTLEEYTALMNKYQPGMSIEDIKNKYDINYKNWKSKEPKKPENYHVDNSTDDINMSRPFEEYFQSVITDDTFRKENNTYLPQRCFEDHSIGLGDVLQFTAQAAFLAVGAKGASTGNVNMASLGGNGNMAVGSIPSQSKKDNVVEDSKALAGVAPFSEVALVGFIDVDNFKAGFIHDKDYKITGYIFPIADVEEHLSHYKEVSYHVSWVKPMDKFEIAASLHRDGTK